MAQGAVHKLRVGVVGMGAIAPIHLACIADHPHAILTATCDSDPAQHAPDVLGFTDFIAMLPGVDVVHICTPHHLHCDMIIAAVQAGVHVLCEKPAVLNLDQVAWVQSARKGRLAKVGVGLQNRFNPSTKTMLDTIQNGRLGRLIGMSAQVNWHRPAEYYTQSPWRGRQKTEGGGVTINQAIHTIDLIQLFGGPVDTVTGTCRTQGHRGVIDVDDTANFTVDFKSGVRAMVNVTNTFPTDSPVQLHLTFELGKLTLIENRVLEFTDGAMQVLAHDPPGPGKSYVGQGHAALIDGFYSSILNDTETYITFDQGTQVLKLLDALYRSNRSGLKEGVL